MPIFLSADQLMSGLGEEMRRGFSCAGEWALLFNKKINKNYPVGEKTGQLARLGRARQDKARQGKARQDLGRNRKH